MTENYIMNQILSHKKHLVQALCLCIFMLSGNLLVAQDCTTEVTNTFACNEQVNVSLGGDCEAQINASTVAENLLYAETSYLVEITDQDGNLLVGNTVTPEHHMMLFNVSVTQICTGYKCWGLIYVEDKLGPPLFCQTSEAECLLTEPEDFGFPVDPLAIVTQTGDREFNVSPASNCDDFSLIYRERKEDLGCDGDTISIIYRTWTGEDLRGNLSTCTDTIYVRAGTFADITLPPHYDNFDLPAFECNDVFDTLPNGNPSTTVTGELGGTNCVNIISYFEDLNFDDVCGSSKKVLRTWNVLDWCTGEELIYDQVIKILDMTDPIVTDVEDTIVYTLPHKCYASFEIPEPNVEDCSEWTYTIRHKQVDTLSDPYTDATLDYVTYDEISNTYTISELPFGQSWISLYIRDDCGFQVDTFFVVDVQDNQLPHPVCEAHTALSLDNNNSAKLFASSLNDGSLDNCGIVDLEVRRMVDSCDIVGNTIFGEFVEFCCADAGDTITVELRAEDRSGNLNQCMIEVRIADELPPLFKYCPSDTIIDCSEDFTDLSVTGMADVYDNCNYTLTTNDWKNLSLCGLGVVTRTFRAEDDFGNYSECWQDITITSDDTIRINHISWPEDTEQFGCLDDHFGPEITGEPDVFSTGCAQVWIDYKDEVFYSLDNQCSKILRTWKVTNECKDWYDEAQVFSHIQLIRIYEDEKPIFTSCQDTVIVVSGEQCLNEIDLMFEAIDNCTPEKELIYKYSIDYTQDGYPEYSGPGNNLIEDFGFGTADISFTAKDKCGNVGECKFTLTIRDEKAPTPLCVGVSWTIGHEGETEIWASDFDLKSFDNCTPEIDLRFSFSEDPNESFKIFTCDDIPNGVGGEISVDMYVFDESDNFDFCTTTLALLDTNDECEDVEGLSARVGGYIETEDGKLVGDVDIALETSGASEPVMVKTSEDGAFMVEGLDLAQNLSVKPVKDDDYMNGVSTLDLVFIQKHILGSTLLDSPYKIIAADINNSGNLSASDLIQLRKAILGLTDGFPDNTSWRFVDKNYEFLDPMQPWGFPEEIFINELLDDEMENDFVGIKVGDINASVATSEGFHSAKRSAPKGLTIDLNNSKVIDDKVHVPVLLEDIKEILGIQFSLETGIQIEGIVSGVLSVSDQHFIYREGKIDFSWSTANTIEIQNEKPLFYLVFTQKKFKAIEGQNIKLVDGLIAEAYTVKLEEVALNLQIRNHTQIQTNTTASGVVLLQNNPNPFTFETIITAESSVEEEVLFTVRDINGKVLADRMIQLKQGVNNIAINDSEQWNAGIYICTLKGKEVNAAMKMVKQ